MLILDRRNPVSRKGDGLIPTDLVPRIIDAFSDHGGGDAVLVVGIAPGEASFDARMPAIGLAILVRHHSDELFAAQRPPLAADAVAGEFEVLVRLAEAPGADAQLTVGFTLEDAAGQRSNAPTVTLATR